MPENEKTGAPEAVVENQAGTPANMAKLPLHHDTPVGSLSVGALTELVRVAVRHEVGVFTGGPVGSHANSGPTGHSNVPGHANFSKGVLTDPGLAATHPGVFTGGPMGSHANSGPTGHSNVPGHANFSKNVFDPGVAAAPHVVFSPALRAGQHANSGPTGHSNVPGHANFNKAADPWSRRSLPALHLTLQDGTQLNVPEGGPSVITVAGVRITRG